jgi:Leucine-rich repeat (LRR) protein
MTALELLQLRQNQLTGTIPFLGSLTSLTDLNIRNNKMTGDIPNEIYSLTALNSLNLGNDIARGNAFHGTFPRDFSFTTLGASRRILANHCSIKTSPTFHLSRAENLHLHNIHLSGTISSNIGRLTNLSKLYLQGNALTGTVPPVIHGMETLTQLFLYNNNLTGGFVCPTQIEECLVSCDNLTDDACRALEMR